MVKKTKKNTAKNTDAVTKEKVEQVLKDATDVNKLAEELNVPEVKEVVLDDINLNITAEDVKETEVFNKLQKTKETLTNLKTQDPKEIEETLKKELRNLDDIQNTLNEKIEKINERSRNKNYTSLFSLFFGTKNDW